MDLLYIIVHTAFLSLLLCGGNGNKAFEASTELNNTSINETVPSFGSTGEAIVASSVEPGIAEWFVNDTLPEVRLPEFESTDIKLYEADEYSIYSVGKDLLFSTGSASLKTGAEQSLKKISSAIMQRNKDGQIRIFVYIDASDNPNFNRDVAERRAQSVREWLQENGNMGGDRIVVQPVIELSPESSNAPKRQKGGRIEIMVRKTAS